MKKSLFLIILLTLAQLIFANPNYNNGNGTIIFSQNQDGVKTTIRKCEIDSIIIGDLLADKNRNIYSNYNFSKKIGKLNDNDAIKILEVCTIEYLNKPEDKWGNPSGELWYKIIHKNKEGYICVSPTSLSEYSNPYFDNRYEILEEINSEKKMDSSKNKPKSFYMGKFKYSR